MSDTEAALAAADLCDALTSALRDAQAETAALCRLDHSAVLELTVRREQFNTESKELLRQLQMTIGEREAASVPGLAAPLASLKSLAAALAKQDLHNLRLATGALRVTRAAGNTTRPRLETYDRRGNSLNVQPVSGRHTSVSRRT